jgi:type I restriction enzyme R subunit
LNRKNNLLKDKYNNDEKYARLHKKLTSSNTLNTREITIFETLIDIKTQADKKILDNAHMIDNEEYFIKFMSPIIVNAFYNH